MTRAKNGTAPIEEKSWNELQGGIFADFDILWVFLEIGFNSHESKKCQNYHLSAFFVVRLFAENKKVLVKILNFLLYEKNLACI